MKKVMIVTTSIGTEEVFRKFLSEYSRIKTDGFEVKMVIIGDINTPKVDFDSLGELKSLKQAGFDFEFLSAEDQVDLMKSKPFMHDLIPWKKVQRRNLGYMMAYQGNYDYVITVDDDNFPLDPLFIKKHIDKLGMHKDLEIISPKNNTISWFNPCSPLPHNVVHRGFPNERLYTDQEFIKKSGPGRVVVSEGLWLGDPDITALSRWEGNPQNIKITDKDLEDLKDNYCLSFLLKSPHNTQNTAYIREVIPALFLSAKNGRYDDIWASYFLKALMYIKEDLISFGYPLVRQDRNDHDILHDLELELYGMRHTVEFVDELFELAHGKKKEFSRLSYLELTRKMADIMIKKSVRFSWYYLDVTRWIELLENDAGKTHTD